MNQVARRISAAWRRRRCFRRLKLCSRSSHEGRCLPIQASKYVGKRPFALASFFVSAGFGLQFFVLIAFFLLPRSAKNSRGRAISRRVPFLSFYTTPAEERTFSEGLGGQSAMFQGCRCRLVFGFISFSVFLYPFLLYKTYYADNDCDSFRMPIGMKVETKMTTADLSGLGMKQKQM